MAGPLRVGVLALQGGVGPHAEMLREVGVLPVPVRSVDDLRDLGGLIIPGGESTTISKGMIREGLVEPIRDLAEDGIPILATCAGMILAGRPHLEILDISTTRNAFGRQLASFEADLTVGGFDRPLHAIFIRAPWVTEHGSGVEVLAEFGGHVVAVGSGSIVACSFHPELGVDLRLHERLFGSGAD